MPSPSRPSHRRPWIIWSSLTTAGAAFLAYSLLGSGAQRRVFMPGKATDGHHQIELECDACHSVPFAGAVELQAACERCHAEELERAKDAHPKSKFTDPRNAERIEALDARFCVTCHQEHRTEATLKAGLTQPEDYCVKCHATVADERPSHRGLAFASCDDAGCHNFHDNRALYEDFLVKRLDEPKLLSSPVLPRRTPATRGTAVTPAERDDALRRGLPPAELDAWANGAHARARTDCVACHGAQSDHVDDVPAERCGQCHASQLQTWEAGKHGLRAALDLEPMRPGQARLPMRAAASSHALTCNACHPAHGDGRGFAASRACLGCHADEHSLAYASSRHAELVEDERRGLIPEGSGVSCATCHMPRQSDGDGDSTTQHNQNDNLRPNEKMIRSVCSNCHGLSFSLDALADAALVLSNFNGPPAVHVISLEMAARRAAP